MSKGMVFSIEEFSVFDGPGIRTTVFLKASRVKGRFCAIPANVCTAEGVRKPRFN